MQTAQKLGSCSPTQVSKLQMIMEADESSSHLQAIPIAQIKNSNEQPSVSFANVGVDEVEYLRASWLQPSSDASFWSTFDHNYDCDMFYQYFMHFLENDIDLDQALVNKVDILNKTPKKDRIKYIEAYIDLLFQRSIKLKKLRILACTLNHLKLEKEIEEAKISSHFGLVIAKQKKQEKNHIAFCAHLINVYTDIYKEYKVNKNADLTIFTSKEAFKKLRNKMKCSSRMIRSLEIDQTMLQEKKNEVMKLIQDAYHEISSKVQKKMDFSLKKDDTSKKDKDKIQAISSLFMEQLTEQEPIFCDNDIDTFAYPVSAKSVYVNLLVESLRMKIYIMRIKINIMELILAEREKPRAFGEENEPRMNRVEIKRKHLKKAEVFVKHAYEYQKAQEELRTYNVEELEKKVPLKKLIVNDHKSRDKVKSARDTYIQTLYAYKNALKANENITDEMIKNRLAEYLQEAKQVRAFNRMVVNLSTKRPEDDAHFTASEGVSFSPLLKHLETIPCVESCAIPSAEKINVLRNVLMNQPFSHENEATLLKCRALLAYYEWDGIKGDFAYVNNQGKYLRINQILYWSYCFLHGDLPLLRASYEFNNQGGFRAKKMFKIYSTLIQNPNITIAELSRQQRRDKESLHTLLANMGFSYVMDVSTGSFSWKLQPSTEPSIPPQSLSLTRRANTDELYAEQPARKKIKYTEHQSEESLQAENTKDSVLDDFYLADFFERDLAGNAFEFDFVDELGTDNQFSELSFASFDDNDIDNDMETLIG